MSVATTAAIDIRRTIAASPQQVYDAWARTGLSRSASADRFGGGQLPGWRRQRRCIQTH
ncbi:MAG: hypothetical protein U0X73_04950 [Thermoanaerobaculia bacterium]